MKHSFKTTLHRSGNNTAIIVPPEVVEKLGGGKKPAVAVTVNGFAYRSTIATMGGHSMISFSSDKRAATGLKGGEAIAVTLELDTAKRVMAVPSDLQAALDKDKAAKAYFATLSYSNQRRHIDPINDAKTPETRARRIEKSVALFHEGKS
ncbi:MAG: YdeI/OmpD-associated family protein [Devosia sp.]